MHAIHSPWHAKVDRYARQLPLLVICELLGLPLADRPKFTASAHSFTRFTGAIGLLSAVPNLFAMRRYMQRQLDAVCEYGGEGLIAELVRVEKERRRISRDEVRCCQKVRDILLIRNNRIIGVDFLDRTCDFDAHFESILLRDSPKIFFDSIGHAGGDVKSRAGCRSSLRPAPP
jgi:hypothetical protein